MPRSTTNAIAKSASPAKIVPAGMISRGKYTFVMRSGVCTRLFDPRVTEFEKKIHGTSAVNEKIG
jgi:hypothetical protein